MRAERNMAHIYVPIHQIHGKHTKMFIEEIDVAIVDSLCNLLADLMR